MSEWPMRSTKARKQKKAFFNAPLHQRRKQLSSHLEENLLLKYDKRNVPLIKGDTIKIMRGIFKGHENKVTKIHLKKHLVEVEGVTIAKADGKQVAKAIHPSNLLITKLNLTDKWRRKRLEEGLSSETKKEIEKEASVQLKELEEERKAEEERKRLEELEESEEQAAEPEPSQDTEPSEAMDEEDDQIGKEKPKDPSKQQETKKDEKEDVSKEQKDDSTEEKTTSEKKKQQDDIKEDE